VDNDFFNSIGQFLPPTFATAMENLLEDRTPAHPIAAPPCDDEIAASINGRRFARSTSITGRQLGRPPSRLWAKSRHSFREFGDRYN
jgi:hypothetical protein